MFDGKGFVPINSWSYEFCSGFGNSLRNMHKITYTSSRLCGGLVTRLTGRREYVHVGLTAAIRAADTCQSSHQTPFRQLSKLFHARCLPCIKNREVIYDRILSGFPQKAANVLWERSPDRDFGVENAKLH